MQCRRMRRMGGGVFAVIVCNVDAWTTAFQRSSRWGGGAAGRNVGKSNLRSLSKIYFGGVWSFRECYRAIATYYIQQPAGN